MTRVTYDGNGHTEGSVPVDTHDYTPDEYAVAADPGTMKRDGSLFSHWESSLTGGMYAPGQRMFPTASLTLRAVWTPQCTIIYDTSTGLCVNGDVPVDTSAYAIGDTATVPLHNLITAYIAAVGKKDEPDSYTLEGMQTCIGWKILVGGKSPKDVLVSGDTFTITGQTVILQTVWGSPEISIAYEVGNDVKGNDIPLQSAQQFRPVKIIELPTDITKVGYRFAHWQDPISGVTYLPGEEATFSSSTVLQAVWYPAVTHTVTYDLDGGYGNIPPQDPVDYGSFVVLPDTEPLKSGYVFGGWLVPAGDHPRRVSGGEAVRVTADLTIVARWIPIDAAKQFRLTYASTEPDIISHGELPVDDTIYVSGDYAFVQSWFPTKYDRHVSRWRDDTGTVYEFGSFVRFTDRSLTLTAVWEDDPVVTIKFLPNASDVSGSVPDIITLGNGAIMMPSSRSYTRDGYEAIGWLLLANGVPTGERYDSGMIYRVPASSAPHTEIQFGVEWINMSVTHSVTYEDILHDFGHLPVDPCKYHAGDLISLPPAGDLRRTGYRLAGWIDSDTQKFYRIPTKAEIESYMAKDEETRGDYGYLCPNAVCRGDHVFRAMWVPTTTIYFGAEGVMKGRPPSPVELSADEIYYLPDGAAISTIQEVVVGWRDVTDTTGKIYPVGSKYVYTGESQVVLQPVWATQLLNRRESTDSRIIDLDDKSVVPPSNTTNGVTVRLVYEMPEGANSDAPVDTHEYSYGEVAPIPPRNGIRGPNGTNLLFWYTLSSDAGRENEIVGRYYPGEMIVIPPFHDPDKIITADKSIILHPFFGDKFGIAFVDPSNCIMPISPSSGKAEYVYPSPITDGILVRTPQMVEQTRDAKTYDNWVNSWEYPYKGTSATTNETIYATRFESIIDYESNGLKSFFRAVKMGIWIITNVIKPIVTAVADVLGISCNSVKKRISSEQEVRFDNGNLPEGEILHRPDNIKKEGLVFTNEICDPNIGVQKGLQTKTVEPVGLYDRDNDKYYSAGDKIQHLFKNVKLDVVYDTPITIWYHLGARRKNREIGDYYKDIHEYIDPYWMTGKARNHQDTMSRVGDDFNAPLYRQDFNAKDSDAITQEAANYGKGDEYALCDRWFPMMKNQYGTEEHSHPALLDYNYSLSTDDMWLWATGDINSFGQANSIAKIPKYDDPTYSKYFWLNDVKFVGDKPQCRKYTYSVEYELRWAPLVRIRYEYESSKGSIVDWQTKLKSHTEETGPFYVGRTPRLEWGVDDGSHKIGGHLKYFERVITLDERTKFFMGWRVKPDTVAYKYYEKLHQEGQAFDPAVIHESGTKLPPIRCTSPRVITFVAEYETKPLGSGFEDYEKEPNDGVELPKISPKQFDLSGTHPNKLVKFDDDKSETSTKASIMEGSEKITQNSTRVKEKTGYNIKIVKYKKKKPGHADAAIAASVAAVAYETHDAYKTRPEYVENLGSPSLRRRRCALAGIPYDPADTVSEQEDAVTVRLMMDPEIKAARDAVIRDESNAVKASEVRADKSSMSVPGGLYARADPLLALSAEGPIPGRGGAAGVYGAAPMSEQTAANPEQELYTQFNTIPEDSRQKTVNMLTGMNGADPQPAVPNRLNSPVSTARLQTLAQYIRDQNTQMFNVCPSRTSIKSGYIIVDANVDTDAKARCLYPGWSETLHVDTLSTSNGVNIPTLVYTPRDPTRTDVHFPGETIVVPKGKRICRVDYLTFANDYDDNIPGYFDANTRTYDGTFLEPHEYHTVLECNVPAEHRPAGMVFAGWVMDNMDENPSVAIRVQPGDKIKQGTRSHRFRALWLPANVYGDIYD